MTSAAELRLHPIGGNQWTWRYVEPGAGIELHSNETYGSREQAAEAARRAYPDLHVADDEE